MSRVFLVLRRTWQDRYLGHDEVESGGTPVAAFATRGEAEDRRRVLEAVAREEMVAPFLLAEEVGALTRLDEEGLSDRIRLLGLTPPEAEVRHYSVNGTPTEFRLRDWAAWYDDAVGSLTEEQRAALWALLDAVRFYEVLEVDLDDAQG